MTGKDFSGPTPEIRAPTPLRMPESLQNTAEDLSPLPPKGKRVRALKASDQDVEIVGDIGDIEQLSSDVEPTAA